MCSPQNLHLLRQVEELQIAAEVRRKAAAASESSRLRELNKQAAREQLLRIQLEISRRPKK